MSSKPSSKSTSRKSQAKAAAKSAVKQPSSVRPAKPRPAVSAPNVAPALPAAQSDRASNPEKKKTRLAASAAPTAPTELSSEVMEFITAIDAYKRLRRRPFPNWSEVFEIVKSLGYHKSA